MNPTVVAAVIAASVSGLTLIGTLAAQYFGRRATSRELDRTFAEQRTRTLNERFATAADQLGSDKSAVRLAGVYAMAGLADDWKENQQTCVDVLCAYWRMPYETDPGEQADQGKQLAYQAGREVRRTVIQVITEHLKDRAVFSWRGLNFDFTGATEDPLRKPNHRSQCGRLPVRNGLCLSKEPEHGYKYPHLPRTGRIFRRSGSVALPPCLPTICQ